MGIEFRVSTDTLTQKPMVEVWKDGLSIASIYGHDDGLQVVSKYLDGVEHEA
ncbi:unnamed protein product, partial [marine sediment metagenome]